METGPDANQSMDRWLLWTGVMEIGNVALFTFLLWYLSYSAPGLVDYFSVAGLTTLTILLVQGGLYWLLKRSHSSRLPRRLASCVSCAGSTF